MAPEKRQRSETETLTVENADALDCGVCYHPLKPPMFQCDEGHVVCSSCRDKLAPSGKCHVCGTPTRGRYRRCRAMERLVETVRVACPNAAHGCDARPVYYDLADHRQVCPHAVCHCPGETCSFAGTTKQLVDHISFTHGWPCITKVLILGGTIIRLQDGFNFLVVDHLVDDNGTTATSTTGHFLFLLNVARQPFGRAVSVHCIHPHPTINGQGSSPKAMKCDLRHSSRRLNDLEGHHWSDHYLHSELSVKCTDLSNGLSSPAMRFQFVVPESTLEVEEEEAISVKVGITIC